MWHGMRLGVREEVDGEVVAECEDPMERDQLLQRADNPLLEDVVECLRSAAGKPPLARCPDDLAAADELPTSAALHRRRQELLREVERWARTEGSAFVSVPEIRWLEFSLPENGDDDHGVKALTYKQKLEKSAVDHLGFIFSTYHIRAWWYELADLLRKLVLVGAVNFVPAAGGAQLLAALAICFTFIVLNCVLSPDVDEVVDRFTLMALFQLYLTLIVGLALKMREEEEREDELSDDVIGVVLVVLDLLIFVTPLCMLLWLCMAPYVPKIQQVGKQAAKSAHSVFLKKLAAWRQRTRELQRTAPRQLSRTVSISSPSTRMHIKENPLFTVIERAKLEMTGYEAGQEFEGDGIKGSGEGTSYSFGVAAQFADSPTMKASFLSDGIEDVTGVFKLLNGGVSENVLVAEFVKLEVKK
ncbi:hypothetical protein CYMTET_18773 [Cymbomonas tetramitiformis]|uniref:Uncharacterized protein n=1 Tax=Cymbomonas tetramitiformis TaxID=36881 RepID=A0AAE0G8Q1_9CHLO|nr:hypothetical protein CYMTET_18773 [Cymbomonas tetramitiformis]